MPLSGLAMFIELLTSSLFTQSLSASAFLVSGRYRLCPQFLNEKSLKRNVTAETSYVTFCDNMIALYSVEILGSNLSRATHHPDTIFFVVFSLVIQTKTGIMPLNMP
jgi:hypothetical protein